MYNNKGQSTLEYSIMIVILIAALLAMQNYVKRGIQGRWKTTVDDFGEQYDPRLVDSSVTHTVEANSETNVRVVPDEGGFYTERRDAARTTDYRRGKTVIGQQSGPDLFPATSDGPIIVGNENISSCPGTFAECSGQ